MRSRYHPAGLLRLALLWMCLVWPSWGIPPPNNNNNNFNSNDSGKHNPSNAVRRLKVSYQEQMYELKNAATVDDVLKQLRSRSGLTRQDCQSAKVLYRGKLLEGKDSLKQKGVSDGDIVMVFTRSSKPKGKEWLAIVLEIFGQEESASFQNFRRLWKAGGPAELLKQSFGELQDVRKEHVSHVLRKSLDLWYHRMRRDFWDHPSLRHGLTDPIQIEAYRQVVSNHLSQKIQRDLSPRAKQILSNPEAWRNQFLKAVAIFFRFGDTVMEGLLDIVLDVVQGAGRNAGPAYSSVFATGSESPSSDAATDFFAATLDDPSLANQMLFELSESEDDGGDL